MDQQVPVAVVPELDQRLAHGRVHGARRLHGDGHGHLEQLEEQWADRDRFAPAVSLHPAELRVGPEPAARLIHGPEIGLQHLEGLPTPFPARDRNQCDGAERPGRAAGDRCGGGAASGTPFDSSLSLSQASRTSVRSANERMWEFIVAPSIPVGSPGR